MSAADDGAPVPPADVPSDDGTPASDASQVVVMPWDDDRWALVVAPDSDVAALAEAAARLPAGLRFVESCGDVDVVLLYRRGAPAGTGTDPSPGAPPGRAGAPADPRPVARVGRMPSRRLSCPDKYAVVAYTARRSSTDGFV